MKRQLMVGLFLLGLVATGSILANRHNAGAASGKPVIADGGAPMPPWPHKVQLLVADGGAPMPPWPHSASPSKQSA
jgi:hypothetical protein